MSNKLSYLNDTIVAAATPQGRSGVSVIRISGKDTENIGKIILRSLPKPRSAKLKKFYSLEGEILDWGIAVYFPGPKSFTGESVLELHCHGSPVVTSSIINEIVTCGARFAGPGEFSKRAFINEKLDLVQAEAVSDLISSQTEKSAKAAMRSMTGEFSKVVELQKEKLTLLRVHIEAAIEFPDEEIIINGGINSIYQIKNHLEKVDGVMIGRTAYHSPYFLAEIEKEIFNNHNIPSRTEVIERMFPYIKEEASKGTRLNQIMRHTIGLFHGQKGSADWKRYLSKNMCIREADLQKVNHIMDHIKNNGSTTSLGRKVVRKSRSKSNNIYFNCNDCISSCYWFYGRFFWNRWWPNNGSYSFLLI